MHHVTATVNDAQEDLDFYRDLLGLRLLKKTVNFDNHSVYHFYYGDERGTPGTIWTTFPYKGWGVPPGRHGRGQITVTSFSVPSGSLDWWERRMGANGTVTYEGAAGRDEPGGILLEVATIQPGFTVDEPLEALGRELRLPPWEEQHRATIEAHLPQLRQLGAR